MHELVRHTLYSRLLSALRLSSFAGDGLPERMRSISFALLGLTAAAGLALVAIFAQPGFTLLTPAPLPDQPSSSEAIAAARKLPADHRLASLVPAPPAHAQRPEAGSAVTSPSASIPDSSGGSNAAGSPVPNGAEAPAPSSTPAPSSANGGGGAGDGTGGSSSPTPTPAPAPTPAPSSPPARSPQPPAPKPEATTAAPKPEPAPAPGHSSSPAAAAHAGERGIEASANSGPPASAPTTGSAAPEAPASPGNGNGLAKGHDK